MTAIRPAAVAGMFYPADFAEANRQLTAFLEEAKSRPGDSRTPKALIAPHAGWVYSGAVAASAYVLLLPLRGTIRRVVLLGPSHRVAFRGLALSDADQWASPLGPVSLDREGAEALKALPGVGVLDQAHAQEHSLEVHVPFLQAVLGEFKLLPIVVGDAPADLVAGVIDAAWGGPETLIVVSTDLSHYLGYDECRRLDQTTVAAIEGLDPAGIGREGACGRVPVGGLLLCAKQRGLEIVTLDVRNSGDTAGPKDRVVGYGSWALYESDGGEAAIRAVGPALVDAAWASIRHGLDNGFAPHARIEADAPKVFGKPGAVFVTLNRHGRLRGCIGSPVAWRGLAEDVLDNAFKAAFKDPRFPPLTRDELDGLELSLSVLTPPVPMRFKDEADLLAQLRVRIDGLIIEDQGKRALFLPSVWEQLPDKAQFIAHLKAKAGMAQNHWSPSFKASTFQAVEIGK
ncbi:extradiol dioxygenase [Paramagnetospirillum marisnigri]|uniref:MEMO1 family protein A6A04_04720 n=1 Tax=Paramagnetospirillum marisnigri TaxID=1285242 RepID=A0A178MJ76_9PROT|nr:AmmeMemoRadiSam system protein B [Paramagnetospirillum marisnigri]OAN48064.1 extradiol dioxygenase [Paramagnetospirillum marisnigri]